MSLTTKLHADYVELINAKLDALPASSVEDFDTITTILKGFLEPKSEIPNMPADLKERIISFQEMYEQPEMYAAPEHQGSFRDIIVCQVKKKINEIEHLSKEEKLLFIEQQKIKRAQAEKVKAEMATHTPPAPGSEAHVVSDTAWLLELQQRFQQETGMPYPDTDTADLRALYEAALLNELSLAGAPLGLLNSLGAAAREFIFLNSARVIALMGAGVSLQTLLSLDPTMCRNVIRNAYWHSDRNGITNNGGIVGLIEAGVPFETVIALPNDLFHQVVKQSAQLNRLLGLGVFFDAVITLNQNKRDRLLDERYSSCDSVADLVQRWVPFLQIMGYEYQICERLMGCGYVIAKIIDLGISFDKIMSLEPEPRDCFLRLPPLKLLQQNISLQTILDFPPELQLLILENSEDLAKIIIAGVAFKEIIGLEVAKRELIIKHAKVIHAWLAIGISWDVINSLESNNLLESTLGFCRGWSSYYFGSPDLDRLPEQMKGKIKFNMI